MQRERHTHKKNTLTNFQCVFSTEIFIPQNIQSKERAKSFFLSTTTQVHRNTYKD